LVEKRVNKKTLSENIKIVATLYLDMKGSEIRDYRQ
jgi:hypothetical protein